MRLIDADALKEDLRHYFTDGVLEGVTAKATFNQILHDIDNAPTVTDERIAHWFVRDGYPHRVYCSRCKQTFCDERWEVWKDGSLPRAYCPSCGAKMLPTLFKINEDL